VRLSDRFKRLTLWNKIGVIGAVASVLGLVFVLFPIPYGDQKEPPVVDLTGWWRLTVMIQSSSYVPYKGLRVAYKIHLIQSLDQIDGRGEKWWEDGKELPYSQHDVIELKGNIDGLRCNLGYVLNGQQRTTSGSFTFDIVRDETSYEGTFSGTGADVSGTATLARLTQ
jgi:hypothetical protein